MFPFGERCGSLRILKEFHTKAQSKAHKDTKTGLVFFVPLCLHLVPLCETALLLVDVINDATVIISHKKRVFPVTEHIRRAAVDSGRLEESGDEIRRRA